MASVTADGEMPFLEGTSLFAVAVRARRDCEPSVWSSRPGSRDLSRLS